MQLHLGCGIVDIPGFYNIDLSDHPHVDLKTDIRDLSKIIGPLYGRMNIVDDNKHPIDKIYHRTVYSKSEMVQVLKNCGFTDIKDYEWQKFVHADYDDQSQSYFPHMQKENGIHIMQNLQDTK